MLRIIAPYAVAAMIIAGLASGTMLVAVLGVALLLVGIAAALWSHWSLRRLLYERRIPEDRAFSGERVAVTLCITNRKPLALPWVEVHDSIPAELADEDNGVRAPAAEAVPIDWRTAAGAYERVSRELSVRAPARGVYRIGPARIRSGDPFGLFNEQRAEERRSRIIVYPGTVDLDGLRLPSRRPLGEVADGIAVFEDPARIAGVREYRPGDSLRRIDWNATARTGTMQARIYEPTSSRQVLICLNTQTIVPAWAGTITAHLEHAISVAASIALDALDRRYSVGLIANSSVPDADRSMRIPPGRREEHFVRILEALAVITPFVLEPLSAVLDREEHRLPAGTTLVVVTSLMTEDLASTLLRLRRRAHQVVVLSVARAFGTDALGDIPVRDVSGLAAAAEDEART
jgi:uncharacterized protein (DUF58 family)